MRHQDPRTAGRVVEGWMVTAVVIGIALLVGGLTVTEIILPAFEHVTDTIQSATKLRG